MPRAAARLLPGLRQRAAAAARPRRRHAGGRAAVGRLSPRRGPAQGCTARMGRRLARPGAGAAQARQEARRRGTNWRAGALWDSGPFRRKLWLFAELCEESRASRISQLALDADGGHCRPSLQRPSRALWRASDAATRLRTQFGISGTLAKRKTSSKTRSAPNELRVFSAFSLLPAPHSVPWLWGIDQGPGEALEIAPRPIQQCLPSVQPQWQPHERGPNFLTRSWEQP